MDDNFTRFPNNIFDRLLGQRLSQTQTMALLYIIRKTYGFQKGSFGDAISKSAIAKETHFSRRAIEGAIRDLEQMGIIEIEHAGNGKLSNMRVKDPSEWGTNL